MPTETATAAMYTRDETCDALQDILNPEPHWYVLWTHSNFEARVHGELKLKGYDVFLPMISQWTKRAVERPVQQVPMFRGYLFVRHAIDKKSYLDICKTKGLVTILGKSWNNLAAIPDEEIDSIRLVVDSKLPVAPYPWLKAGTEVRITRGPMTNAKGILVRSNEDKGHFVVSIQLMQRSVAVNIDCCDVEPA